MVLRNLLQKGRLDINLKLVELQEAFQYITGFTCEFYFKSVYVLIDATVLCLGKYNNDRVLSSHKQEWHERGHSSLNVKMPGFIINPEYSWLGSSSDGVVHDPGFTDPNGILEIKCPYNYRDNTVFQAAGFLLFVGKG